MSSLYKLSKLSYSYSWAGREVPVLRAIDLEVEPGSFSCFIGPSGTGKTTLLNILGLLDRPSGGQVLLDGEDVGVLPESRLETLRLHKIGFIFQSFYLIPTLTVLENTTYFLPQLGISGPDSERRAKETLDILGLSEHCHKMPGELSGGQRQRVAIARAIVKKPAVVLADEPTANLDSETASLIIRTFQEIRELHKTSFIFSTHDPHLVSYASTVFKMKDGSLMAREDR